MKLFPKQEYYGGTLRVKNPKTLQKWKDNEEYQKLIEQGYFYYSSCGRFRKGDIEEMAKCCRKSALKLSVE